jgi:hypothetical protein
VGTLVATDDRAAPVGNGAFDFCEGHRASSVAHGDNGEKGVECQAGNDVSCSGTGGEIGQVECAGVRRLHLVTVGEVGDEGYRSWDDVAGGCIGGEKMACCS